MEPEQEDIKKLISSASCSICSGETDGFKCPKCGYASKSFDPSHWRQCSQVGKMQAKCKKCGEAEYNCGC